MVDKIKRRLSIEENDSSQDNLIIDLIEQNRNYIMLYLGVSELSDPRLDSIIIRMSIEAYNLLGEEGKKSASYADYKIDMQTELISPYRTILKSLKDELSRNIRFIY